MFRIIIAGGRDFRDYDLLVKTMNHLLANIGDDITVICGKARGADTLGERYAKEHGHSVQYFPADWDKYGKTDLALVTFRSWRLKPSSPVWWSRVP